jgi:hypothetical protein
LCLEAGWLSPELCGGLLVQWVQRVRLDEEEYEAEDDWVHPKDRLPVCTQDVEAYVAVGVNVRVVDGRVAVDLGRLVRVCEWNGHAELILSALPQAVFLG